MRESLSDLNLTKIRKSLVNSCL